MILTLCLDHDVPISFSPPAPGVGGFMTGSEGNLERLTEADGGGRVEGCAPNIQPAQ